MYRVRWTSVTCPQGIEIELAPERLFLAPIMIAVAFITPAFGSRLHRPTLFMTSAAGLNSGQIDGATVVDAKAAESLGRLLSVERPDIVFTQWPIDTHLDHQAASTLTFRAWLAAWRGFGLYYHEGASRLQTLGFSPN